MAVSATLTMACEQARPAGADARTALARTDTSWQALSPAQRDTLVELAAAPATRATVASDDAVLSDDLSALVAQFDEQRLRAGLAPVVVGQWQLDPAGMIEVTGCRRPLEPLDRAVGPGGLPSLRWPGARPSDRVERGLRAWLRSCDGLDDDSPVWVQTLAEAPLLAAWWPEADTLLVHPLALEMLEANDTAPAGDSRFATAEQPILATVGGCVQNLEALCGPCAIDVEADGCARVISVDLSTGARVVATCGELVSLPGGAGDYFDELCIGQLIGGREDCVVGCTGSHAQTCVVQPSTGDATLRDKLAPYDQLLQRHCREALDACLVGGSSEGISGCEIDIGGGAIYSCMDEVMGRCDRCLEGEASDCAPLFVGSGLAGDCEALGYPDFVDSGPVAAYCARRGQLAVSCLDGGEPCVDASVTASSVATLAQRFAPMFDPTTSQACLARAEVCWNEFSSVCHRAIVERCNACLGVELVAGAAPADCDPLFVGSTIAQDCLNLGFPDFEHPGLTAAWCAWQHQIRPSCLNGAGTCAHGDIEARSLDTFALRYAPFIDADTRDGCVAQANACWDGQPIATVPLEPPPWRVEQAPASGDDGGGCGE